MKILVAMSGGVDSSVAAALLAREGHCVAGGTLRLTDGFDPAAAASVCAAIGAPHHVIEGREAFARHVTEPFSAAYRAGLTPNPCLLCNKKIKFGLLLDWAVENGFDAVATGHYARAEHDSVSGRWRLLRAAHVKKDQSYALYSLSQEQLSRALFPIGGMSKDDVRAAAAEMGLPAANMPDSQDICFVPGGDYLSYIRSGMSLTPGLIVTSGGVAAGRHEGIEGFTIGQRKGIGGHGKPLYVIKKDPVTATVTVGPDEELYSRVCRVKDVNWILSAGPARATVKTRYTHAGAEASVIPGVTSDALVEFDKPQRALTPGQAAVFYDGDYVLGGGVITDAMSPFRQKEE